MKLSHSVLDLLIADGISAADYRAYFYLLSLTKNSSRIAINQAECARALSVHAAHFNRSIRKLEEHGLIARDGVHLLLDCSKGHVRGQRSMF